MTTTTTTVRPLPVTNRDKKTTAGNYFISNYPPFSFWSTDQVSAAKEMVQRPPALDTKLGMYIHLPFCRKRCHFCYFKVYTGKEVRKLDRYVAAAKTEAHRWAEQAVIGDRPLKTVYFGGGTPSFLSAAQLRDLFEGLQSALPWDQTEEVTFECEPGTLNEEKLKVLRDLGVTRLSLGIENFNDHVLKTNNRAHGSKPIYTAYETARNCGFPQINVDLIAGMLEETEENWAWNVERTLEIEPDCVTIYQMEIPFNTTIYQQMEAEGQIEAPVADWDTKRRWVKYALGELEKRGYTVTSGYTAAKDNAPFIYRDALFQGWDIVPVGVSSFGFLSGMHLQNQKDIDPYMDAAEGGELPLRKAYQTNETERFVREFILGLKKGWLDTRALKEKFGVDPLQRFEEPLRDLEKEGFIWVNDGVIKMDRDTLLQVDSLLHQFFLPEHQDDRFTRG